MPWRPKSHQAVPSQPRDFTDYNQHRRTRHGPDPRGTARWKRLRLMVLAATPLCGDPYQFHAGQLVPATEVDHILGVWDHPELRWDLANLRGLCTPCHRYKTRREVREKGDVWLVCGPPGSGKSHYVQQHRGPADVVVDWDLLFHALRGATGAVHDRSTVDLLAPYVWAAYDAVVDKLAHQSPPGQNVWVIASAPEKSQRQALCQRLAARCVVLAVPLAACLAHLARDPERCQDLDTWQPRIADWWERYEPDPADRVSTP